RHDDLAAEASVVVVAVDQLRAGFSRQQRAGGRAAMLVELGRDAGPVEVGRFGLVLQHPALRSSNFPNRHPGLEPGSTGPPHERLKNGPRLKAGVTNREVAQAETW